MTAMTSELSAIFACTGVWRKSGWVMGDSIKWLRERLSGWDSDTRFQGHIRTITRTSTSCEFLVAIVRFNRHCRLSAYFSRINQHEIPRKQVSDSRVVSR
jgi:hypothetical protein